MLEIKTFEVGSFGTNMYLVSDGAGNTLLIDPACSSLYEQQMLYRSGSHLEVVCQQRGLSGEAGLTILATHGHLDHLWGAAWACEQWHTPVLMHEADIPMAKAMQAQYDLFGIGILTASGCSATKLLMWRMRFSSKISSTAMRIPLSSTSPNS